MNMNFEEFLVALEEERKNYSWYKKLRRFLKRKILFPIRDIVWWFKYRLIPKYRYHVLKLDLPPGYHDPDERLCAAIIKCFKNYIEERGGIDEVYKNHIDLVNEADEVVEGMSDPEDIVFALQTYKKAIDQDEIILAIYHYIFHERAVLKEQLNQDMYLEEYAELRKELNRKDKEMFTELIQIMDHLWT